MSTEKYDREIKEIETELNQIIQMGENMKAEYKEVILAYLPEAIDYLVNRAIKNNPDAIERLGAEKIRDLKSQISAIVSSIPSESDVLIENTNWGHKSKFDEKDISGNNYDKLYQQTKMTLEAQIRLFLGRVGSLLVESEIEKMSKEWGKAHGSSSMIYTSQYALPNTGSSQNLKQLDVLHNRYQNLIISFASAIIKLRQAQKSKQAAEAKNLWDSA